MENRPPTRARRPIVDVFSVDGGRSWIFGTTSLGAAIDISCIDGGRSRISSITSQGGLPSMFLALMVGAPRSLAPSPKGPTVNIFFVDGGRSRISGTASQGVAVDVSCVDAGHS
jgi:hypothetical protein